MQASQPNTDFFLLVVAILPHFLDTAVDAETPYLPVFLFLSPVKLPKPE
jgi:hypothetical protein